MALAVFDLDGTLYSGHVVYGLTRYLLRIEPVPGRVARVWGRQLALYPQILFRLLTEDALRARGLDNLALLLAGMGRDEVARMAEWVAREYVAPRWRADVVALARDHQARGDRVIMVSGTPQPLLPPIGALIGIDAVIGTELEIAGGRYTGRVREPICQGEGKALRLEQVIAREGPVPWNDIVAYADHHTDIPLLTRAGRAVAVYPNEKLATYASVAGWTTVDGSTPQPGGDHEPSANP